MNIKIKLKDKTLCNDCPLYSFEKQRCRIYGQIKQRTVYADKYKINVCFYPDAIRPQKCKRKNK